MYILSKHLQLGEEITANEICFELEGKSYYAKTLYHIEIGWRIRKGGVGSLGVGPNFCWNYFDWINFINFAQNLIKNNKDNMEPLWTSSKSLEPPRGR